jgi:hypothetical protein
LNSRFNPEPAGGTPSTEEFLFKYLMLRGLGPIEIPDLNSVPPPGRFLCRAVQFFCTPKSTMEPCTKRFRVMQAFEPDSQAKFAQKQPEIAGKGHGNDKNQR